MFSYWKREYEVYCWNISKVLSHKADHSEEKLLSGLSNLLITKKEFEYDEP